MGCRRDTSPIFAQLSSLPSLLLVSLTFMFFLLPFCSLSVASHPFTSGTFSRYLNKHNFGSLYDGTRPQLPISTNTFFSSNFDDRTANNLIDNVSDYFRSSGSSISVPDLSGVQHLLGSEMAPADEMTPILCTELKPKSTRSTDLRLDFDDQKGQFVRKNCFFSPLQCSFYYKKRSHHRRNAPFGGGEILEAGTVISSSDLLRSKAF